MADKRIGLLFVHGIGEQKRFGHLRDTVRDLAEIARGSADGPLKDARISVEDRTESWALPPGEADLDAPAPISLHLVEATGATTRFDCHEVWWADLGERTSLLESVRFWIWGLGQWAAPIYRELDAAGMSGAADAGRHAGVIMPRSVAGRALLEFGVRVRLWVAAITAFFSFFSWSILKRASGAIFKTAPDPDLIVQYLGDVRTYERRASPNSSRVSDPGHPIRVPIRRRMVTEMVAMGARDLDGWYIVAHSLGTVVAYNGLTELGHTLPNYLTQSLWRRLPWEFRRDPGTLLRPREKLAAMMPSRPPWLRYADVINRKRLFAGLQGVLTYGSPLDKFAAMWPRIVATGDDRQGREPILKDIPWLNVAAPHDPVAGILDSFSADPGDARSKTLEMILPRLVNWATPADFLLGLSHVRYFRNDERFRADAAVRQRQHIAAWLLGGTKLPADGGFRVGWPVRALIVVGYVVVTIVLGIIAIVLVGLAGDVGAALLGADLEFPESRLAVIDRFKAVAGPAIGVALGAVTASGLWRAVRETTLNRRLGQHDRKAGSISGDAGRYLERLSALMTTLAWIGLPMVVTALLVDLGVDWRWVDAVRTWVGWCAGWMAVPVAAVLMASAATGQSLANKWAVAATQPR